MIPTPDVAMVLAAGLGTRMRPLTDAKPKPLITVAGKPLIDYALDRFAAAGVRKVVVNVHYLADQVEDHMKTRDDLSIAISDERAQLLETGGGLKKAEFLLGDDPIYCTNTDAILVDDGAAECCARLAATFDPDAMDALLLLVPKNAATGYDGAGDFDLDAEQNLVRPDGTGAPFIFTGLQLISPILLADAPSGPFSTRLLWDKAGSRGRLKGLVHDGRWMHVGDPDGLELAENWFAQERAGEK